MDNEDVSPTHYHKTKSLVVRGGFLDRIKIEFDENLNCFIEGRGTGKTTVIGFIRYVRDRMPARDLSSQYKSIERLSEKEKCLAQNSQSPIK